MIVILKVKMLRFLIAVLLTLSTVTSYEDDSPYSNLAKPSAASSAQIKFAIENNYDDTGPGAKTPEKAYNIYKNLDDALIAYLDDPDTKLPEHDRERAVQKLLAKSQFFAKPSPYYERQNNFFNKEYPKTHFSNNPLPFNYPTSEVFYSDGSKLDSLLNQGQFKNDFINNSPEKNLEPFKFQKFQSIKSNPLSLGHYVRDSDFKQGFNQFESFPKQTYPRYTSGDLKHSAATRNAGIVHGYYTFIDSDGKHRTVYYSTKDSKGNVQKSPTSL